MLKKVNSNNKIVLFLKNKFLIDEEIPLLNLFIIMALSLFTGLLTPIGTTPYKHSSLSMLSITAGMVQYGTRFSPTMLAASWLNVPLGPKKEIG